MNKVYIVDYKRNNRKRGCSLRFLYVLRTAQCSSNRIVKFVCKTFLKYFHNMYGLEILPETEIGRGCVFSMPSISQSTLA